MSSGLERAEKKLDSSRSSQDSSYFELVESGNEDNEYENLDDQLALDNLDQDSGALVARPRASMLDYTTSKCAKRQVVHVHCRDLECGVRPQLVSTRARYVLVSGALHFCIFKNFVGSTKLLQRHFCNCEYSRRIVGGANSTPGAWPWQAALYKEGDFQCGATLISSQWLVSAGHCFYQ